MTKPVKMASSAVSRSLSFKLLGGLSLALMVIMGISFYLQFWSNRKRMMETFKEQSTAMSNLVRVGLEDAMLRNDFQLLHEIVNNVKSVENVERITIISRNGRVKESTDHELIGRILDKSSGECGFCHQSLAGNIPTTEVVRREDGSRTFRSVTPIYNRPACQNCHNPADKINGILMFDLTSKAFDDKNREAMARILVFAGVTALAIMLFAGALLNRLVLARMKRFMKAMDSVDDKGMLPRVEVASNDEFGALAESFNNMSEKLGKTMEELRYNRGYLQNLIDTIEDEIIVLDREGNVVKANTAARRKFGEDVELSHRKCHELFTCISPGRETCPVLNALSDGKSSPFIESRVDASGQITEMEVNSFLLFDDTGLANETVFVARDISMRKNLEAKLIQRDRLALMGQLASSIAHEINNPLGTISVCITGIQTRLRENPPNLGEINRYLEIMQLESFRSKTITSNMLDFARQNPSNLAPHNLRSLIEETLSIVQFQARANEKNIIVRVADDVNNITTDGAKLKQVFLNLILNALDAMDKGRTLTISAKHKNGFTDGAGMLMVSFADDGIGIPPHIAGKIFEPFFTSKPPGAGTGLGLFICRSLMEQLGGSIYLGEQTGVGSEFIIELPEERKG